jgi:hypothetical protein
MTPPSCIDYNNLKSNSTGISGAIRTGIEASVQLGMRTTTGRLNRMEFPCRSRPKLPLSLSPRLPLPARSLPPRTQAGQAVRPGWGVGAGLVGAAIVGTAIAASNDGYYYDGYRRCGWVRQFDAYGNYMGRVAPALSDASSADLVTLRSVSSRKDPLRLKTLLSWILRPARAPHPPRVAPDPPGCPPGRVNFFECSRREYVRMNRCADRLEHAYSPARASACSRSACPAIAADMPLKGP